MARKVFTGAGAGSATITAVYTIGGVSKTATKSITVNKADGGVTITNANAVYGSSSALANVSGATGTVHYRVGTSGTWSTTIPTASGRNAGSYTLQYYVDASDNYNAFGTSSAPKSLTVTINKANGSAGTTSAITKTFYTSTQQIVLSNYLTGNTGTITWPSSITVKKGTTTKTWTWTKSSTTVKIPGNADAGDDYTITATVSVAASDNYNAVSSASLTWNLTILPREISYSKPSFVTGTLTYNGNSQNLVNTGTVNSGGGTMYYYTQKATTKPSAPTFSTSTWSTSRPAKTDAGKYFIWYYVRVTNTTNYVGTTECPINIVQEVPSSSENSKTINKATGGVTITDANAVYGSNSALATVSNQTGTIHYRLGTSGSFVTTIPTATTSINAGTYTLYYYVDASDNYNAFGTSSNPKSLTVTIQKANNQIVVSPDNWEGYNRAGYMDIQLTVTNNKGTVTYSSSNTNIATVNSTGYVSGKTVGECDITVTDPGNSNYNSSTAVAHITILQDYIQSTQYKDSACTIQGINTVYNTPSGNFTGNFTAEGGSKTVNCSVTNNTNWYQKWESGYVEQKTGTATGTAVWKITSNGNNQFYESGIEYGLSGIGQTRKSGGSVQHRDMEDNVGRDTVVVTIYNAGDASKTSTISAYVDNSMRSLVLRINEDHIDYNDTTFGEVYASYDSGYTKLIPSELVEFTTNPSGIATITANETEHEYVMEVDDFDGWDTQSYEYRYVPDQTNDYTRHAYEYVEPVKYNGNTYYLWRYCSNNHDKDGVYSKTYLLTDTNNIDTLYSYSIVSDEENLYTRPFVAVLNNDLEPYGDVSAHAIYNAWEN